MPSRPVFVFEPFRLDPTNEQLLLGEEKVRLTPKAFAVLDYFVQQAGKLVTRQKLSEAVWPQTYISEARLTGCVSEVRQALEDDPHTPRFIETVHRRGYCFIAPVTQEDGPFLSIKVKPEYNQTDTSPCFEWRPMVGREGELAHLQQWFATTLRGERQIGFITGEAGIGKTTLVDAYIEQIRAGRESWVGHGQCIEQYGSGDAYLPVLEALGRLCRGPEGETLIASLAQHAPSWLIQMPTLLSEVQLAALQPKARGVTKERMLRELSEAIEILTAERPLVLVLEDLHWSDYSTLELLAFLARRREAARLLVLGTYRPVEVTAQRHPIRQVTLELRLHDQCEELSLDYLSESGVRAYLLERFAYPTMPHGLVKVIHRRTNGNPLFIVTMIDVLVRRGLICEDVEGLALRGGIEAVETAVPEKLQYMIEYQLEQLSPEDQELLEAASAMGADFSTVTIAAAVNRTEEEVEAHCEALTRQKQFVKARDKAVWPDGSVTALYGFIHPLYQEVLYNRIPVSRRIRLHQCIGAWQEVVYGELAWELATELAVHFARGQEPRRAIQYLQRAAENSLQRNAYREALDHLTKALTLIKTLPSTLQRTQQELDLQMTLGPTLAAIHGYTALDVEQAYTRARDLCQLVGQTHHLFYALRGLRSFYSMRADHKKAEELEIELLHLAERLQDPALLTMAQGYRGESLIYCGKISSGLTFLRKVLEDRSSQQSSIDFGHVCWRLCHLSHALWMYGRPDQALHWSDEALKLARTLANTFNLTRALFFAARLHRFRGEVEATQNLAEEMLVLAESHEFVVYMGALLRKPTFG